jgi:WD40-like Beta Propeller Repeat
MSMCQGRPPHARPCARARASARARGFALATLALAALAATSGGCGPSRIWSGRTADRRHTIEVIEDAGLQHVVIDGRRRAAAREIAAWSIAVSEHDHLAFAARAGGRWVVVRDGADGEPWDAIGALAIAPDGRLAYAAARAGGWHVVVDGRPGPRLDALLPGSLQLGAGGRVVYAGEARGRVHVVTDGAPGPAFDAVAELRVSADGARVAYTARRGGDAYVVVDGQLGPRWSAVGKLALGPAGGHIAYAALDREGWRVIVDGVPGPKVGAVRHIALRDDGRHAAWIERIGERDVLVLDGAAVAWARALRPSAVTFRPAAAPGDGAGLTYVLRVNEPAGGERVVVDGVAGAAYREVGTPVWSRSGRLAYPARRADGWVLVEDGREHPGGAADAVGAPVFSPDGRRLAYLVRRGRASIAVVDGREHRFSRALEDSLAFSADGRRWAVIAGEPSRAQLFIAVGDAEPARARGDDLRRVPVPAAEVYAAAALRPPESLWDAGLGSRPDAPELLRVWSRAEADRGAAP